MLGGRSRGAEWLLRRKDGSWLPVEVNANILPDGQWQGFVRDISLAQGAAGRARCAVRADRPRPALAARGDGQDAAGRDAVRGGRKDHLQRARRATAGHEAHVHRRDRGNTPAASSIPMAGAVPREEFLSARVLRAGETVDRRRIHRPPARRHGSPRSRQRRADRRQRRASAWAPSACSRT